MSFERLLLVALAGASLVSMSCTPTLRRSAPEAAARKPILAETKCIASAPHVDASTTEPDPVEPSPPTVLSALDQLLRPIAPAPVGETTLLLGLHVETVESYAPLYDEGKPVVNEAPGYQTLVLHTASGKTELVATRPYLAIPEPDGLVLASEVSVVLEGKRTAKPPGDGNEDGFPPWYSATEIVTARDEAGLSRVSRATASRLKSRRSWGHTSSQSILYATPRAFCRFDSDATWTGGALAFSGTTEQALVGIGKTVDPRLSAYVDREGLVSFAEEILHDAAGEHEDIDIDAPVDIGWDRTLVVRKDARACFAHEEGMAHFEGAVVLSGNSARTFSATASLGALPRRFGSEPGAAIDFGALKKAFPDASDAVLSPSRGTLVVLDGETLRVIDVATRTETFTMKVTGRVVMSEWSEGEQANARALSLRTPS